MRNTIGLFFACLFVACSPVRYMSIETYNPAEVTFPEEVKRVLVVNNTVPQESVPYESVRKLPDSVRFSADSAAFDYCRILAEQIAEFPSLEDVRLLEDRYQTDDSQKLTKDEVNQLCEEHGVDAVISLDRLLFNAEEYIVTLYGYAGEIAVNVAVSGILRTYLPDRITTLCSIALSDTVSLMWDQGAPNVSSPLKRNEIIREAAQYMASESSVYFVPFWGEDTRWYFVSSNARWKENQAFMTAEKWENAIRGWEALYNEATGWNAKARLAVNLALCTELTGDLTVALRWATQSLQLYKEHLDKEDRMVLLQSLHVKALEYRIKAEEKLRRQIGGKRGD
jgi:hypothetical protein